MFKATGGNGATPPRLTVGFWNIQRATNPELDRAKFMIDKVREWITLTPRPDVIILAEVTQTGDDLRRQLSRDLPDYRPEFVPVANSNGGVSPCSFLVLGRRTEGGRFTVDPVGVTMRRPYMLVTWNGLTIAGLHATADQGAKALNDICDVANDFRGTVVIGDMNLDPAIDHGAELNNWKAQIDVNYERQIPRDFTYESQRGRRRVLDYALVRRVEPTWTVRPAPVPTSGFEVIDHLPIAVSIW